MRSFKLILLILLSTLLFPANVTATHAMGGEVTWECTPQGNYRFIIKLYRECYTTNGGSAASFGSRITMFSSVPGMSYFHLYLTTITDISPKCHQGGPQIHCNGLPNGNHSLGAVQEYVFTSDSIYPQGIDLGGIPPVNGWVFEYSNCCRNPSANILWNSDFYTIIAKMFPYHGQNSSTCYDNAPSFSSTPVKVVPNGVKSDFILGGNDKDGDSLVYSLTQPLRDGYNIPVTMAPGFTYLTPFPDTSYHAGNIPLVIDSISGTLSFTNFTLGAYALATKVTSYRDGIRISEVHREMQVVIVDVGNNNPPLDSVNGNYSLKVQDIFYLNGFPGDTILLNYTFIDTNSNLSNGSSDLILNILGENLTDTSSPVNCTYPPCAIVTSLSDSVSSMLSGSFFWILNCNHLLEPNGNQILEKNYAFFISCRDDFCPVPASKDIVLNVRIQSDIEIYSPDSVAVVMDSLPYATIYWNKADDPYNTFQYYVVCASKHPSLGFNFIDTIYDINQCSTSYVGPLTTSIESKIRYFSVRAMGGCTGLYLAEPRDTAMASFGIGIDDKGKDSHLLIKPNPTDGIVYIQNISFNGDVNYNIYTENGALVQQGTLEANVYNKDLSIDISALRFGVYILYIVSDGQAYTAKILKK